MDNFHSTELEKALSEQHYGIIAYRIDNEASTNHIAVALVDLLEQRQIRVKLSNRGYEVLEREHADYSDIDRASQVFETLDGLLSVLSPMYKQRHMEGIIARLSQLAESPS